MSSPFRACQAPTIRGQVAQRRPMPAEGGASGFGSSRRRSKSNPAHGGSCCTRSFPTRCRGRVAVLDSVAMPRRSSQLTASGSLARGRPFRGRCSAWPRTVARADASSERVRARLSPDSSAYGTNTGCTPALELGAGTNIRILLVRLVLGGRAPSCAVTVASARRRCRLASSFATRRAARSRGPCEGSVPAGLARSRP